MGLAMLPGPPALAPANPLPTTTPPPAGGSAVASNNPYAINFGQLPFNNAGGALFQGLGGTGQQALNALGPGYQHSYDAALDFNKSLGDTVNTGYNTAMQNQLTGQQGVMDTISHYGAGARQDIADRGAQQMGAGMQSMIGRGLGNFTVTDAMKRGVNYDQGKLNLTLDDQIAQMKAGYQNQAIGQNTNLAGNQLNFLERMNAPYPNAGLYGQLATQYGATGQANADRAMAQGQFGQQIDLAKKGVANAGAGLGAPPGGGQVASRGPMAGIGTPLPWSGSGPGAPMPGPQGGAFGQQAPGYGYAQVGAADPQAGMSDELWNAINGPAVGGNTVSPGSDNPYAGGFYDYGTPFDAGVGKGDGGYNSYADTSWMNEDLYW